MNLCLVYSKVNSGLHLFQISAGMHWGSSSIQASLCFLRPSYWQSDYGRLNLFLGTVIWGEKEICKMKRHLVLLATEAQPNRLMWHLLWRSSQISKTISLLLPVSIEAVMVSIAFPFLSAYPRDTTSSWVQKLLPVLRNMFWFSFSFPYRLPSTNPGDRRNEPIGRDRN